MFANDLKMLADSWKYEEYQLKLKYFEALCKDFFCLFFI